MIKPDWSTIIIFTAIGSIGGYFIQGFWLALVSGVIAFVFTLGFSNLVDKWYKEEKQKNGEI